MCDTDHIVMVHTSWFCASLQAPSSFSSWSIRAIALVSFSSSIVTSSSRALFLWRLSTSAVTCKQRCAAKINIPQNQFLACYQEHNSIAISTKINLFQLILWLSSSVLFMFHLPLECVKMVAGLFQLWKEPLHWTWFSYHGWTKFSW